MATYYVRKTGSDSNAGTSAGAAWLTIGKALGAAGISSGDTVYIGAGVYREIVTVAMTSATAETFVIGDVDGVNTGDAGEIQWTAHNVNDYTVPINTANLNLAGRDYLTIRNITFIHRTFAIIATTLTSTNITIQNCSFLAGHQGSATAISHTTGIDIVSNWLIDSCIFRSGGSNPITFSLTRPSAADLDVGITIKNCMFINGATVSITTNGANAFKAGGIKIYNCSFIRGGYNAVNTNNANVSTTIPILVYNCFIQSGTTAFFANLAGQIVEDYNLILGGATPRTNVTAGAHSISDGSYSPLCYSGFEPITVGSTLKPLGMPYLDSPLLGFGNESGSPTVDISGVTRPVGVTHKDSGTATAGGTKTLTDSGKTWGTNVFNGYIVKITGGTGSGQVKTISSNTATVLTVDGNWNTQPSTDSTYVIYSSGLASSGTSTAGSTTTLTDGNAAWSTNMWQGYTLEITAGTGSPQTLLVISNTATVLTFAVATSLGSDSVYKLYRGTSENVINPGVGCYETGLTAVKETTTVRTGTTAIKIAGAGYHDFQLPVSVVSTTVTVYGRYDSLYSGTLPQMKVLNGTECGVSNATDTMAGAANTWEQLSLNFTPTSSGIVTIRVQANSTTPTGSTFFDDFDVV